MEATYNWEIENIGAVPRFTDKNGVVRENVIKVVNLAFVGRRNKVVISRKKLVRLSLMDLANFTDASQLTKETVLQWALDKLHPKEKEDLENNVKFELGDLTSDSYLIAIDLD